jgi:hypothetical protein
MQPPNGIAEIISTFGDVHAFVDASGQLSPEWASEYLGLAELPFSLPLSWNPAVSVNRMTCHKLLIPTFEQVFATIQGWGLPGKITSFGGCFEFRAQKRNAAKLSTHAWGIAIDINPLENEQGTAGNMDASVIDVFREVGFEWGGDWPGRAKDPMHFQFATGY